MKSGETYIYYVVSKTACMRSASNIILYKLPKPLLGRDLEADLEQRLKQLQQLEKENQQLKKKMQLLENVIKLREEQTERYRMYTSGQAPSSPGTSGPSDTNSPTEALVLTSQPASADLGIFNVSDLKNMTPDQMAESYKQVSYTWAHGECTPA